MEISEEIIKNELVLFDKTPSMDEIFENLFIGNYSAAADKNILKEKGIKTVLVAAKDLVGFYPNDFVYKIIPLYDSEYTNISKYFEESNCFIKDALFKGRTLVHCGAGVSRSVSLVIAYLISQMKMSYSEAFALVKDKRNVAKPNSGFEKQLRKYSYEINKRF